MAGCLKYKRLLCILFYVKYFFLFSFSDKLAAANYGLSY